MGILPLSGTFLEKSMMTKTFRPVFLPSICLVLSLGLKKNPTDKLATLGDMGIVTKIRNCHGIVRRESKRNCESFEMGTIGENFATFVWLLPLEAAKT